MAQRTPPFYISTLAPRLMRLMSQTNLRLYRWSGGRIAGGVGRLRLCLLTTTGRRSGLQRTTPLLFVKDGDNAILVAAQGGLPVNPDWYWNLVDQPEVAITIGRRTLPMLARVATDSEREDLWPRLTAHYRGWADYQSWTDRVIPVVICEPRGV